MQYAERKGDRRGQRCGNFISNRLKNIKQENDDEKHCIGKIKIVKSNVLTTVASATAKNGRNNPSSKNMERTPAVLARENSVDTNRAKAIVERDNKNNTKNKRAVPQYLKS